MDAESLREAMAALHAAHGADVEAAVQRLARRLPGLGDDDFRAAVEALSSLFYIDTYDRPDLEAPVARAVEALGAQGLRVVPLLLELMQGSDVKSHIHLAQAIARVGGAAVPPLCAFVTEHDDPYGRSFALFAIGKVQAPEVAEALGVVRRALRDPDKEVRDSAARVVGKIAVLVPAGEIDPPELDALWDGLWQALDDRQPAVRAKVVRSLGKLAAGGHLDETRREALRTTLRRLLGADEHYDWDRAYIVRREAEEALAQFSGPGDAPAAP